MRRFAVSQYYADGLWTGNRPIEETVACVQRALDENAKLTGPLTKISCIGFKQLNRSASKIIPDVWFGSDLYFARVRSESPGRTKIELYIPTMQYNKPLHDLLAKCA
jgi:hypothetical protein